MLLYQKAKSCDFIMPDVKSKKKIVVFKQNTLLNLNKPNYGKIGTEGTYLKHARIKLCISKTKWE
jgi:hypothetical protein